MSTILQIYIRKLIILCYNSQPKNYYKNA